MKIDLTGKNLFEVKQAIIDHKEYHDCAIELSKIAYNLLNGQNSRHYQGLKDIVRERRISVVKSDKDI